MREPSQPRVPHSAGMVRTLATAADGGRLRSRSRPAPSNALSEGTAGRSIARRLCARSAIKTRAIKTRAAARNGETPLAYAPSTEALKPTMATSGGDSEYLRCASGRGCAAQGPLRGLHISACKAFNTQQGLDELVDACRPCNPAGGPRLICSDSRQRRPTKLATSAQLMKSKC